ncbi:hypothetical protein QQP08_020353, partial [Theobroma cacao]
MPRHWSISLSRGGRLNVQNYKDMEGNRAADKLAQIGHQLKKPQIWWHIPPNEVLPIVHEDAEGEIKAGQWKSVINRKLSKFYHLTYQSSGPYLEPE